MGHLLKRLAVNWRQIGVGVDADKRRQKGDALKLAKYYFLDLRPSSVLESLFPTDLKFKKPHLFIQIFFFCHIFPPEFELRPFLQHFCCHWPQNSFIVCKNAPFVGRISRLLSLSPRNKQASLKPKYRQARRRPSPSFLLIDFLFRFEKRSHASTLKMLIGQKNANTVVSQGTTILKSCIIRVEKIISRQITYLSNSATASGGPLTPIAVLKRLRRPRGRALT